MKMNNKKLLTESMKMEHKKFLLSSLILVWLILPWAMSWGATNYYIDRTNGSNVNPGTIDEPFATLEGARYAIRSLKNHTGLSEGGVIVCLREGIYPRSTTFELNVRDSGTVDKPIVYCAYPGEEVMISGGESIVSSWSKYNSNIYVTNVGNLSFNSLFVNGQRATRAREPDPPGEEYYYLIKSVDPETNLIAFRFTEGDIDPKWYNLREIEVVIYRNWEQARCRIDSIEGDKVYLQGSLPIGKGYDWNYYTDQSRYLVENVFEGLDTPGEWYLNKNTGDLYYWPLPGEDIHNSEIVAPIIEQVIEVRQASYITFRNLTFSHTDWQFPKEAFHTAFNSTVGFYEAEHCTVEDCVIKHAGGTYAVGSLWGFTNNNINLIGNEIYDIGGGGISFCSKETENTGSCIISDNIIHDIGKVDKWVTGVYFDRATDFTVSHNLIYNAPYGGVGSVAGNYQDSQPSNWKKNIIEYNEIYNVMQELNDGGAIHVAGHQPGTLIQYNKIHDIVSTDMHQTKIYFHGVYLHDGAEEFIIKNNLVYRTDNGLLLYNCYNNTITNNIFIDAVTWDLVFSGYANDQYQQGNIFTKNITYATGNATLFLAIEPLSVQSSDYNLFYTTDPGNPNWNLEWWKTTYAFDQYSIEADPSFVDYENDDFRLRPESPAFSIGLTQIDLSGVGPRRKRKILYGDVSSNSQITAHDAFLAAQYAAGLIDLTPEQILAADVNGDGRVSGDDSNLIDQYAMGLIAKFPADNRPLSCDLSDALDTTLGFTRGGNADWYWQAATSYNGGDAARSGAILHNQESWMQTTVSGCGTVKFYWKVSSEYLCDFLKFYVDGSLQDQISGSVDWQQITYTLITPGSHTLEWRYIKDGSVNSHSDCSWVDKVQWVTAECGISM
jgi:parallel beta-helix repeat protein